MGYVTYFKKKDDKKSKWETTGRVYVNKASAILLNVPTPGYKFKFKKKR